MTETQKQKVVEILLKIAESHNNGDKESTVKLNFAKNLLETMGIEVKYNCIELFEYIYSIEIFGDTYGNVAWF